MARKPELLCPAGDMEKLQMAVLYGADAVYLAGTSFGMRSFTGNFTPEQLPQAIAFAHEHGVRVPEDVFVTGFDGIKIEQYHKPRLTTAVRNNAMIAEKLLELADGITSGEYPEPFDAELSYEPVFSESCWS